MALSLNTKLLAHRAGRQQVPGAPLAPIHRVGGTPGPDGLERVKGDQGIVPAVAVFPPARHLRHHCGRRARQARSVGVVDVRLEEAAIEEQPVQARVVLSAGGAKIAETRANPREIPRPRGLPMLAGLALGGDIDRHVVAVPPTSMKRMR